MTKKIFWQDPYLTQLDTRVKTVNGNQLTVHETIFYAFSGGQESDHGTLGGQQVLEAKKEGQELKIQSCPLGCTRQEIFRTTTIGFESGCRFKCLTFIVQQIAKAFFVRYIEQRTEWIVPTTIQNV